VPDGCVGGWKLLRMERAFVVLAVLVTIDVFVCCIDWKINH